MEGRVQGDPIATVPDTLLVRATMWSKCVGRDDVEFGDSVLQAMAASAHLLPTGR